MIVIGDQRPFHADMMQQIAGDPTILAGDDIGLRATSDGARRDIAEVADRRRHQMPGRLDAAGGAPFTSGPLSLGFVIEFFEAVQACRSVSVSWRPGFRFNTLALLGLLLASACAPNVAAPPPPSQPQPQAEAGPAPVLPSTTPTAPVSERRSKSVRCYPAFWAKCAAGRAMLNAAKWACLNSPTTISLVVRDTAGRLAARTAPLCEALADGAKLVLGPFFAADVKRAAAPSRAPMCRWSASATMSRRPATVSMSWASRRKSQVDRVVSYAASQNLKRASPSWCRARPLR